MVNQMGEMELKYFVPVLAIRLGLHSIPMDTFTQPIMAQTMDMVSIEACFLKTNHSECRSETPNIDN